MLFIMLNQIFQSELGYIPLRSEDMFHINYKNTSYIWGPGTNDAIGTFLSWFCPDFFKVIPVGDPTYRQTLVMGTAKGSRLNSAQKEFFNFCVEHYKKQLQGS